MYHMYILQAKLLPSLVLSKRIQFFRFSFRTTGTTGRKIPLGKLLVDAQRAIRFEKIILCIAIHKNQTFIFVYIFLVVQMEAVIITIRTQQSAVVIELFRLTFTYPGVPQLRKPCYTVFCSCRRKFDALEISRCGIVSEKGIVFLFFWFNFVTRPSSVCFSQLTRKKSLRKRLFVFCNEWIQDLGFVDNMDWEFGINELTFCVHS